MVQEIGRIDKTVNKTGRHESRNHILVSVFMPAINFICTCIKLIIISGFTDLHIHAPQFCQSGLGMDLELLDWLRKYTFHREEQFSNIQYAENIYTKFVDEHISKHQGSFFMVRLKTFNMCTVYLIRYTTRAYNERRTNYV